MTRYIRPLLISGVVTGSMVAERGTGFLTQPLLEPFPGFLPLIGALAFLAGMALGRIPLANKHLNRDHSPRRRRDGVGAPPPLGKDVEQDQDGNR